MKGLIAWFAGNSVAANLLMGLIVIAGLFTLPAIKQEIFPEFSLDLIVISVVYRGAAPEEVEEGVCLRIEEAVQDLEGIKHITANASEGGGSVTVELEIGYDSRELLDDIKARIDAIETFPVETEKPVITELTNRRAVIDVVIWGDAGEGALKAIGQRVRDGINAIPGITQVDLVSARPYEIAIEISETDLRRYGLTFEEVARAIRRSSLDLPGGSIRAREGEILLRATGQAYEGDEFASIVLRTRPDGTRLLLGDVANVVDGFAETDESARFSGKPAVGVRVFRVGNQAALDVAEKVKAYVDEAQADMPAGVTITHWNDQSRILRGRLDLMTRSARNGYLLVLGVLALFLRFRLAFWVSLGIPISFLGAIWLMPALDVSVNLISLFAFIVVLGIVVDDAIIIGENIFKHQERDGASVATSARGAAEVALPVVFGILTTVAAFYPLLNVVGTTGKIMRVIPTIVIATLLFSMIESLLILPAHLAHKSERRLPVLSTISDVWRRFQGRFSNGLTDFVEHRYRPFLYRAIRWRYTTLGIAVATLVLTIGVVSGGWIRFQFFPRVESDFVAASLTLTPGTSVSITDEAMTRIESAAIELQRELKEEAGEDARGEDSGPIVYIYTGIGNQPFRSAQQQNGGGGGGVSGSPHLGEITLELTPSESRTIPSVDIAQRWREKVGPIPDAVELTYSSSIFSPGEPINIELRGQNIDALTGAAARVKEALRQYDGVFDITDSFRPGKSELELSVKPAAEAYGVTLADLALQVRQAFYGEEAQRIQRGRDDVRVMVRFPSEERRTLGDLENLRIRTPGGLAIPFVQVAEAKAGRGYASIRRVDRERAVNITADIDVSRGNANQILAEMAADVLPGILADFNGVRFSLEGQQREQAETMQALVRGFILALIVIYGLMAIPFRSYLQPFIVMSVIPFGIVGAVWGHVIMRLDLTILSMFGIVALTGVVVNDSIVFVHFVNQHRGERKRVRDAVVDAGTHRFRPILLTSLTTFAGLMPLLLEKSVQAKFLVPMAVSLGFGVLFATLITLVMVPLLYVVLIDLRRGARAYMKGLHGESDDLALGETPIE